MNIRTRTVTPCMMMCAEEKKRSLSLIKVAEIKLAAATCSHWNCFDMAALNSDLWNKI